MLFRYADDFILSVKGTREQATAIMDSIRGFFKEKLTLNLSAEKTRVVPSGEWIRFSWIPHPASPTRTTASASEYDQHKETYSASRHKLQAMLGPSCMAATTRT